MRVLIRSAVSGQYRDGEDRWVDSAARARNFRIGSTAADYIGDHRLEDVEIVYQFADARYNFSIPGIPSFHSQPSDQGQPSGPSGNSESPSSPAG